MSEILAYLLWLLALAFPSYVLWFSGSKAKGTQTQAPEIPKTMQKAPSLVRDILGSLGLLCLDLNVHIAGASHIHGIRVIGSFLQLQKELSCACSTDLNVGKWSGSAYQLAKVLTHLILPIRNSSSGDHHVIYFLSQKIPYTLYSLMPQIAALNFGKPSALNSIYP